MVVAGPGPSSERADQDRHADRLGRLRRSARRRPGCGSGRCRRRSPARAPGRAAATRPARTSAASSSVCADVVVAAPASRWALNSRPEPRHVALDDRDRVRAGLRGLPVARGRGGPVTATSATSPATGTAAPPAARPAPRRDAPVGAGRPGAAGQGQRERGEQAAGERDREGDQRRPAVRGSQASGDSAWRTPAAPRGTRRTARGPAPPPRPPTAPRPTAASPAAARSPPAPAPSAARYAASAAASISHGAGPT